MSQWSRSLCVLLLFIVFSYGEQFPYSGTVTDTAGTPVEGARVVAKKVGQSTATDRLGRFGAGADAVIQTGKDGLRKAPLLRRGSVHFSAQRAGQPVSIQVCDLKGRVLCTKQLQTTAAGRNTLALDALTGRAAAGVYITTVNVGGTTTRIKGVLGMHETNTHHEPSDNLIAAQAAVRGGDSLFVNAPGYTGRWVTADSSTSRTIELTKT
ncbi:MAG: carboxypeptidase-like regulatory domain-containing protein, partial [Fibrobacterota bacterium]